MVRKHTGVQHLFFHSSQLFFDNLILSSAVFHIEKLMERTKQENADAPLKTQKLQQQLANMIV